MTPDQNKEDQAARLKSASPRRQYGKRRMGIFLWLAAALAVATFIFIVPVLIKGASHDALIRIPKGATLENVKDTLERYMGEDYTNKVVRMLRIRDIDYSKRNGAYRIEKGQTPYETMLELTSGAQAPLRLTINGFRTKEALASKVAAKMEFGEEEFLEALQDSAFLSQYGLKPDQGLALLFNDTYEVYWSASPRGVLEKIAKNYTHFWNTRRREEAASLGLAPSELMTLGSIVDEETNEVSEKGRIGRLYLNRLQKGMALQADPTVRYAIGDFTVKRVKGQHLKYESPYNTYLHKGLPPAPIRTTSKSTVAEILESKPSDDLYMCAKEDFSGVHNFASTYEEHLSNAKRYQEELNKLGYQ